MGSKAPEANRRGLDTTAVNAAVSTVDPPKPAGASGILHDDLGGDDDDDDGNKAGLKSNNSPANEKTKKKRKACKKKKKKAKAPTAQTSPPLIELATLFPAEDYPTGELVSYAVKNDNLLRTTAEELRYLERLSDIDDDFLRDYRKAAEVHRQVRGWAQKITKPGVTLTEIALEIEEGVRALTGHQGIETGDALKAGMAFPTGLCVNNIAAHWTPNAGAKDFILQQDDVLSVDFGVHVNGRIVDSAFTVVFNTVYDNLLAAVKDATNTGLREAGIDARIAHISECIQEAMESYEVGINGRTIPIKAIRNITGHDIKRYKIHGDKQIPFVKTPSTQRMEEGEVFAIETFGTTGRAYVRDDIGIYGYGRNEHASAAHVHHTSAKALLKTINENFGTIVFARRYLERLGVKNYILPMKTLVSEGIVEQYRPLSDVPGSYVAQFEHTLLLRPECKEVVSRGDDY